MTINGSTKLAGVFGWPVAQSRSPLIHNYWLDRHGINGAYVPFSCEPKNFREALKALPKLNIVGANVTLPHKQEALAIVDEASQAAKLIGAVNTVVVKSDGRLFGTNTDTYGFLASLKSTSAPWASGTAVVMGAGGAARAVIYALRETGLREVCLANRTRPRAEELAQAFATANFKITVHEFEDVGGAYSGASLLVNTTSLGMTGELHLDISLAGLPQEALVTDLVYSPLQTALLKEAAERGNPTLDGLGMLLHQAAPGFEAWFGTKPEVTEDLRAHVLADLTSADEEA